jgi:hypothetical protein
LLLFYFLFKLILGQESVEIRTFAATQLRKNLSNYSQSSFKNIWEILNADTQNFVRHQLFESLQKETVVAVRHLIADAIG